MTTQLKSKFTKNGAKKSKGVIHEGSPIILIARGKARFITRLPITGNDCEDCILISRRIANRSKKYTNRTVTNPDK